MRMAPKLQARAQSARPRHPQAQPLPPPATAAAAAQVASPRYSACCTATSRPPAHSSRATRWMRRAGLDAQEAGDRLVDLIAGDRALRRLRPAPQPPSPRTPGTRAGRRRRSWLAGSIDATTSMRGSSQTQNFRFASAMKTAKTNPTPPRIRIAVRASRRLRPATRSGSGRAARRRAGRPRRRAHGGRGLRRH